MNRTTRGIGASLAAMVLVAILPLPIFGGGASWILIDQKKAAVAEGLAGTTRALLVAVDLELAYQLAAMNILTADAGFDAGNLPAFRETARRYLAVHAEWDDVVLIDTRTHAIVPLFEPQAGLAPSAPTLAEVDDIARTGRETVLGVLPDGEGRRKPIVRFLVPVVRDGRIPFVLSVAMDPARFNNILFAQHLPATWTGAIIDNRLTLAARSRYPERFVGKRATPGLVSRITAGESGMFLTLNQEGQEGYNVFTSSPTTHWNVVIGIPASEVDKPIKLLLVKILLIGGGLMAFALTLTVHIGSRIVRQRNAYERSLSEEMAKSKSAETELRVAAIAFESQEGKKNTDTAKVILRVNRAFSEITGYSTEEAIGQTPRLLASGRHGSAFYDTMMGTIRRNGAWQGEIWNRRKNGEIYPGWLLITAVKDEADRLVNYVATLTDITQRKSAEKEINSLAFYDPLTALPNRRLLFDRLKQCQTTGNRSEKYSALLLIDLDNFKLLNDTHGHDVGDQLLRRVAQKLSACIRESDTVARLGGDEFIVLLEELDGFSEGAANMTEAIGEKILAALKTSFQLGNIEHRSSASIGATLFMGNRTSMDDLLKQVDLAMYKAKEKGRNNLRFFDPAMQTIVLERAALETDLRKAVEENQLVLHYQAQVVGDGRVTGVEVLVRWQHPQRGMVPPLDFIPLAEDTGLILPLGNWVLETACDQLAVWASQTELAHLTIAVNVSAKQFREHDFVENVLGIVKRTGANPRMLKLELTESMLVDNVDDIIEKMYDLKAKGVGFSLDDFGTGYSSLFYLKRLPLDQLKIDQSFVRDVLIDPADAAIAKTIITLANSLGISVIAEGVESNAQKDFLARQGCHAYQGYLFSRPLPVEDFEHFLQLS